MEEETQNGSQKAKVDMDMDNDGNNFSWDLVDWL
jgi:hypothetical protein